MGKGLALLFRPRKAHDGGMGFAEVRDLTSVDRGANQTADKPIGLPFESFERVVDSLPRLFLDGLFEGREEFLSGTLFCPVDAFEKWYTDMSPANRKRWLGTAKGKAFVAMLT